MENYRSIRKWSRGETVGYRCSKSSGDTPFAKALEQFVSKFLALAAVSALPEEIAKEG